MGVFFVNKNICTCMEKPEEWKIPCSSKRETERQVALLSVRDSDNTIKHQL